jgi:uncharacterized protein YndB with AHSA1/START domain
MRSNDTCRNGGREERVGNPDSGERVVIRRLIDAPRAEVFAAWTDAAGMRDWMCPGTVARAEAELDVRPGGRFRIVMVTPNERIEHTGVYRVVEAPAKLVFTWTAKGSPDTLVTIEFFERGDQCELMLTHEFFPDAGIAERYKNGWGTIAEKLSTWLAT